VFAFEPVYAPDAPAALPAWEVAVTCLKKAVTVWLPHLLRIILAAALWLLVAPLATSWLYRIWIHRSRVLLPVSASRAAVCYIAVKVVAYIVR
jgi:hypothetical protein